MIIEALIISLKVVVIALVISLGIGIALNYFNKRKILDFIILIPMFLPPSAIGYMILLAMGNKGIVGKFLEKYFDISIIFTITGAIIVGIVVAIPIMYQSIKISLLEVEAEIKLAGRDLGATKFQVFRKISLPLSKRGILTGVVLSIGRIFGEFGATILVAGNIRGKTQTIPMALYYAIENGEGEIAKVIMILIVAISIILTTIYNFTLIKK